MRSSKVVAAAPSAAALDSLIPASIAHPVLPSYAPDNKLSAASGSLKVDAIAVVAPPRTPIPPCAAPAAFMPNPCADNGNCSAGRARRKHDRDRVAALGVAEMPTL